MPPDATGTADHPYQLFVRPFALLGLLVLLLAAAAPASAAEAYVPFLAVDAPGSDSGRSTSPTVELFNLGGKTRSFTVRLTPAGADGRRVREPVAEGSLLPAAFAVAACCTRQSGLLVASGAPQVAIGARLGLTFNRPPPNSVLARLPVLTARDALRPGTTGVLQTLQGTNSGTVRASLGIVNLGRGRATCRVDIGDFQDHFPELFEDVVVPPLSLVAFPDVFRNLRGASGPASVSMRTQVRCDQPFYPFGINFVGDLALAPTLLPWVEVVTPSVPLGVAR
jgi:hypothetical protein